MNITISALKIAGIYAVFSLLWIFFSDQILFILVQEPHLLTTIQSIKGWLFVMVTSVLIFTLLRREIHKIYEVQKEVSRTKNLLEEILEEMPSAVICFNNNAEVIHWNRHAVALTSHDKSNAKGMSISQVNSLLPFSITNGIGSQDGTPFYKNRIKYKLGDDTRYANLAVYPVDHDNAQMTIVRIDDVTENVQAEELVIQSEKLSSIGGMAAGMAHEINNPLAMIVQGAQNIQRRLSPEQAANSEEAIQCGTTLENITSYMQNRKIPELLEGIVHGGERAAAIIKSMLKLSRNTTSSKMMYSIADIIEAAIELGASDYDLQNRFDFKFVKLKRDYDSDLPEILCCPNELQQVFINLFKNGIQAMESIETEGFKPEFHIKITKDRDFIKVIIRDNGPGMTETTKRKIFEPFYTTKPVGSGTGLGLSVSHSIIAQHHAGTFEVESEVGKGTAFTVGLPIIDS